MTLWRNAARLCATGMMMFSVGCQALGPSWMTGAPPRHHKVQPTHSAQQLLAVARQYEKEGDMELASVYYQRVLSVDPMNAEAGRGLYLITTGRSREQHDIQQLILAEKSKHAQSGIAARKPSPEEINADIARLIANAAAEAQVVQAQSTPMPAYVEMPIQAVAAPVAPPVSTPTAPPAAMPTPVATAQPPTPVPAQIPVAVASAPAVDEYSMELENPFIETEAQVDAQHQTSSTSQTPTMPVIAANAQKQPSDVASQVQAASGWTATNSPFEPRSLIRLCQGADTTVLNEVEKLDHADPRIRKQGLTALADMGGGAQTARLAVKMLLDDPDESIVAHAAWALWEIDRDAWQSVAPLTELLGSPSVEVVQFASYTLGAMGSAAGDAIPGLRQVVASSDATLRLHAAEALISIDPSDKQAVATLIQLTHHSSTDIRTLSVMALGKITPELHPGSVEALTLALRDLEPQVRSTAALSLGALGQAAASAIGPLREAATSDDTDVSEAAAAALACIDR